ncbi:MAG: hypothetical protein J6A38_05295 [Clostridia bacterium]|nr:hypothetical protein [Clostridia bacterium]
MEIKENVYEMTDGAEQQVDIVESERVDRTENREKEGSTVPEKFKDVDALARAYNSLQAEFTRRSQRLKELEREVENRKDGALEGEAESGVEKLRKNAKSRKAEAKEFDKFLAEVEIGRGKDSDERPMDGEMPAKEKVGETENGRVEDRLVDDGNVGTNSALTANEAGEQVKRVANSGTFELSPDTLYEHVCRNEGVRLKIIGEYLSSIGKSGAPVTAGGGGAYVSAPVKAKNIGDAGDMALQYFKKAVQTQ